MHMIVCSVFSISEILFDPSIIPCNDVRRPCMLLMLEKNAGRRMFSDAKIELRDAKLGAMRKIAPID